MKTTIVPAQVTSVEDRIAGNLSFKQLLLMIVPVFISAGLFIFLPPFANYRVYKLVISIAIALICLLLALRIKERLIADWMVILSRYNARPLLYVYNKNTSASRQVIRPEKFKQTEQTATPEMSEDFRPQFVYNTVDEMTFEERLHSPGSNIHFTFTKKGGLRVHIKEVE